MFKFNSLNFSYIILKRFKKFKVVYWKRNLKITIFNFFRRRKYGGRRYRIGINRGKFFVKKPLIILNINNCVGLHALTRKPFAKPLQKIQKKSIKLKKKNWQNQI